MNSQKHSVSEKLAVLHIRFRCGTVVIGSLCFYELCTVRNCKVAPILRHHSIKAYGEVELKLNAFSVSAEGSFLLVSF